MSLMQSVCDLVEERPGSTIDDLLPELPGYSRAQVKQALNHSSFNGNLRCERQRAKGRGKGSNPGRYYAAGLKPAAKPFVIPNVANSVWQLGSRA
jgi:hypothetical protein